MASIADTETDSKREIQNPWGFQQERKERVTSFSRSHRKGLHVADCPTSVSQFYRLQFPDHGIAGIIS